MCKLLSGYAAMVDGAPRVWVSDTTDSHTEIAQEYSLRDLTHTRLFAWEFAPDVNDVTPDVTAWQLSWDSDATFGCREKPPEDDAVEFRAAIERAAMRFVFTGDDTSSLKGWYFGRSQCFSPRVGVQVFHGDSQCISPEGGEQFFYDRSRCYKPEGGQQVLYNDSRCLSPKGGRQWFFGYSRCHKPEGGEQRFYDRSRCRKPEGGEQVFHPCATYHFPTKK